MFSYFKLFSRKKWIHFINFQLALFQTMIGNQAERGRLLYLTGARCKPSDVQNQQTVFCVVGGQRFAFRSFVLVRLFFISLLYYSCVHTLIYRNCTVPRPLCGKRPLSSRCTKRENQWAGVSLNGYSSVDGKNAKYLAITMPIVAHKVG